jgi:hydroxypyruvate isomerase
MNKNKFTSRRDLMKLAITGLGGFALQPQLFAQDAAKKPPYVLDNKHLVPLKLKGNVKQSAARWCYNGVPMEELCLTAKALGLVGIDLAAKADWETLKKHGLIATMVYGAGTIPNALNRKENHDALEKEFRESATAAAPYGWKNFITFSGNRKGMPDGEAMDNCVIGLNRLKVIADEFNITLCFELLNSKVNHKDYHFDHMPWGVEVMKRVNSPRVKILYDIYHAQIMDGDIIATIKNNFEFIGHFHTGGVPGRHELDDTQELNWRTVIKSIADLKYQGVIAHEFVPVRDPLTSLREAVVLSDV